MHEISRSTLVFALFCTIEAALAPLASSAVERAGKLPVIEPKLVHLRSDAVREWSSFPATPQGSQLEVRFAGAKNVAEHALRLRQQDVKQAWRVLLNGKPLGELARDEADMMICLPLAAGALVDGENLLRIEATVRGPQNTDDIRVGELRIEPRPMTEVLGETALEIEVLDSIAKTPLPARITIATAEGTLQQTAATSNDRLAVRPGVIYTTDGLARFGLPAGTYTLYAGRGFEYSLAHVELTLAAGETAKRTLTIRREVPTPGYVACDTHIHTLTHSGHGDATIAERMITLAGEGIEFPIATDHNTHIDYEPHARRLGVRQFFTPVVGNEVTTSVGHFNIFPVAAEARMPDYKSQEWGTTFDQIFSTPGARVAILNHARDLHSGTRPFGPKLFNAAIGENVPGWPMRFNALEVVNSGATQTDVLQLFRDWMALLNRGYFVTPVGSSDSHDVARFIVGQGRTYIRATDRNVSELDISSAVESFLAGRVMVSYGLLAELTVNGKYISGDIAAATGDEIQVDCRVLGPHWTSASRVLLYANGELIREAAISRSDERLPLGVKWQGFWKLPRPAHDVSLVAIALGPGIDGPFWPTAKPYQPTSPDWTAYVIGCSGAVWVDSDGDGRRFCAKDYAQRVVAATGIDPAKLIPALAPYDAAIAAQAAHLYHSGRGSFEADALAELLKSAPPPVAAGFRAYDRARRACEEARLAK